MATRNTIAAVQPDGTIKQIYCQHDGYIERNGLYLKTYYNSLEKANELIDLGDISTLGIRPNPIESEMCMFQKNMWDDNPKNPIMISKENHSYETPQQNTTIAYHRDRKEEFRVWTFQDLKEYLYCANNTFEAYNYIFKDNQWHIVHTKAETYKKSKIEDYYFKTF